jgi:NAD(P)-dependent dehydrogenase (short-subunit alcohol dehydrogenase family)
VVNDAATVSMAPFLEPSPSGWHETVAVNLDGTVTCTRRVLEGMLAADGAVDRQHRLYLGTIGADGRRRDA